jgi:uncharacterized protein DUF5916/cellulose/xylan binding protein with CBM9 domain
MKAGPFPHLCCLGCLAGAALLVGSAPAAAQSPAGNGQTGNGAAVVHRLTEAEFDAVRATRILTAVRTTDRIELDGRLDEPAWALASPAKDFIVRVPDNGAPAGERTEVRVVYDQDNIYFGVMAYDSQPSRIFVKELKRDFDLNGTDVLQVIIDSLHDGLGGYSLSVNPAGARRDNHLSLNGGNVDWDAVWDVATRRTEEGWIAEYSVPFKTLRFTNAPTQEWGIQFSRRVIRLNEESVWSPLPFRFSTARMNLAGTLRGLENVAPGRNFKVKPYFLGQTTQTRVAGEMVTTESFDNWDDYGKGFDIKYSLTPALTLDTTYRTDFAQVEADQQQVNLTRFNLFFPEKREFFLENTNMFTFGPGGNLVPFFSRRIGLSAAGVPVPVLAGARTSGQVGRPYNLGVLAMRTDAFGLTPANNYFVGRMRRNLMPNSWVGAIGTHRDSTNPGDYNRVYGADAHFQFYDDRLEFEAYLLRSDTPGRSGENLARRFQTGWRDDELTINVEHNAVLPNFNPEVGFVRRGDISHYAGELTWAPRVDHPTIQNYTMGTTVDYYERASLDSMETRVQEANAGIRFRNNGSTNFTVARTFDRLFEPFNIRPNITIPAGDYEYTNYVGSFNIGQGRQITGNASYNWGEFWDGKSKAWSGAIGWRPDYHFSFDGTYSRNAVTLPGGPFTTNLIGARFLYAFTPRAFFNAFLQYNRDTKQVSSNIRFNITYRPLSDIYVVYNDTRDTVRGQSVGRSFTIKITRLFDF